MTEQLTYARTVFRAVDFLSWQRKGNLNLRPAFQRQSVWSAQAKSYLIDTVLRGFPVPLIFLQDRTSENYEPVRQVVDGQQRIRTVLSFIDPSCLTDRADADDFAISKTHRPDLAGQRFEDLSDDDKQRILNYEFSVHILPSTTPSRLLLEIFQRMNSTGVKVNEQELRNAHFTGQTKQLCYRLGYEWLDQWMDWGVFSRSQISRMKEVELTSELLLLMRDGLSAKRQKGIDDFYALYESDEVDFPYEKRAVQRFSAVMSSLDDIMSPDLGELYGETGGRSPYTTQGWFYVLFALLYDLLYGGQKLGETAKRQTIDISDIRSHLGQRAAQLRAGDFSDELLKALRGAATDTKSRQTRFDFLSRD